MRKFVLISSLAMVAACNQAPENAAPTPEATPAEDLASHVGAAIVTQADGTKILTYSTADGKTFGAALSKDFTPATWAVEGDKACITPPKGDKFCITYGPAKDDGSVPVTGDDGKLLGSFVPFGEPVSAGTVVPYGAGADIATPVDGKPFLSVWTKDGKAYRAVDPGQGTWRADNGKRCGTSPGQTKESCSTPGPMGADRTFVATSDDGNKVTVQFID